MLVATKKIQRYTEQSSFESYQHDEEKIDATLRNLEIIGEAAKNIPVEVRNKYPNIAWRGIARFRDVIVHHYFGVDLETVWNIIENELPVLFAELEVAILNEE